jgi:phage I-like protein
VLVRKADRKVVALHSAALTNKPAIVGMRPIVNRQDPAAESEILQEVAEQADRADQAVEALRLRLNLPADCDLDELLIAAEQRLSAMAAEAAAAEAHRRVTEVLAAGKLIPNQRDWANQLALKDPAAFDAWAATAVPVVSLGQTQGPGRVVCGGRDQTALAASARASFRADPALQRLTSEQAWVAEALREAGFEPESAQSAELE